MEQIKVNGEIIPEIKFIFEGIIRGDQLLVCDNTSRALENDLPPKLIIEKAVTPAFREVERLFDEGEYYIPELLMSARASKTCISLLIPIIENGDSQFNGKIIIGSLNKHDNGKYLVKTMLECSLFEVIDLGEEVGNDKFINAIFENNPDILAISYTLTTSMAEIGGVIRDLETRGIREKVKSTRDWRSCQHKTC